MAKKSAGILAYRRVNKELEVLLVHPGGPFFIKKDAASWSIPKGEFPEDEDPLTAAKREIHEELGFTPQGEYVPLSPLKQKSGKIVYAWVVETDFDVANMVSNTFTIEWPPRSGKMKEFPEVDKAAWYNVSQAREKINPAQAAFIDELKKLLQP